MSFIAFFVVWNFSKSNFNLSGSAGRETEIPVQFTKSKLNFFLSVSLPVRTNHLKTSTEEKIVQIKKAAGKSLGLLPFSNTKQTLKLSYTKKSSI